MDASTPAGAITAAIVVVVLVGLIAPTAAASGFDGPTEASIASDPAPASSQAANATATPVSEATATPTAEPCEPGPEEPMVQQADLHTSDSAIERGSPGRVEGAIVLDLQNNCPILVQITMNVPNDMYIESAADIQSGGGGVITSTFVVEPGEVKDIAATVYGTEPGEHDVITDITYYPVGHRDQAREIDGLTLTFEVVDPVEPPTEPRHPAGGANPVADVSTLQWLLGLVSVAVVGLLFVAGRKTNIRIRK